MIKIYYFSSGPRERILKNILCNAIRVEKVFITDPEKNPKIKPTIELAQKYGIPIIVLEKKHLSDFFLNLDPMVICLSAGFKFLFPRAFIDFFKLVLNVHGTLLPHYAGARTLNWIVANGEEWSGVTVHRIDYGMDTGPILLQDKFPLTPFDTGKSLYRKTLEIEPHVVVKALKMIDRKDIKYQEQNYEGVPLYPNRTPEHSRIDPTKPLLNLINEIRAADPDSYPAFFDYYGQRLGIKLFRLDKPDKDADTL